MREFRNAEEFSRFLGRRIAENSPVLEASITAMAENLHRRARSTFGDLDKLQELKESTIQEKTRRGYTDPEAPLIATGELRDSLEVLHEGHEAGVGTSDMKMVYHEFGTIGKSGFVPPRPVLQIAMDETKHENQELFKAGASEALGISIRRTLFRRGP